MAITRSDKVKKNIKTALLLQAFKMTLAFANRIVFVKIMGASFLGIHGLFGNVLSILSIADLGMYTVMMYSLYKPLAEKNEKLVAAYVNLFNKIYSVIAVIVGVVGIAILPFLKYVINLPDNIDGIYLYYVLMLINVVVGYLFIYRTTILQADQKSYILDRIDICMQLILFLMQMAVLLLTKNFALYLAVNIFVTLLANLLKTKAVKKRYKYINTPAILDREEKNNLLANIKSMFLYKIGGVIQSNTDNILISLFVGTLVVGYYSNYTMIILAVTSFVTMVFNTLKASIGNYNVEKDKKTQEKMFYCFEDYNYVLIGFCSVCFFVLMPDFIELFFGRDYLLETITLVFIVLNFYTTNIRQNLWVYRETTGIFSRVKYTTLVTSAFNIVFSIVGGMIFGITGIIAATVLSRMLYNWWKEPSIIFKEYFKDSPKKYYCMYISRILYVILISLAIKEIAANIVFDNLIAQCLVRLFFVVLASGALLVLPTIRNESFKLFKMKVFSRGGKTAC